MCLQNPCLGQSEKACLAMVGSLDGLPNVDHETQSTDTLTKWLEVFYLKTSAKQIVLRLMLVEKVCKPNHLKTVLYSA